MSKAIGNIILSLLFLISTNGVLISAHYCGENLQSVSFLDISEPCCDSESNCCHDESTFVQVEDDYLITSENVDKIQFESPILEVRSQITFTLPKSGLNTTKLEVLLIRMQSGTPSLLQSFLL